MHHIHRIVAAIALALPVLFGVGPTKLVGAAHGITPTHTVSGYPWVADAPPPNPTPSTGPHLPGQSLASSLRNPGLSSTSTNHVALSSSSAADATAANVIASLPIPSDQETVYTPVLARNQPYTIRIEGTYVWGQCDPFACPNGGPSYLRWGDAQYLTDDDWAHESTAGYQTSVFFAFDGAPPSETGHPLTHVSGHVYTFSFLGDDRAHALELRDCAGCYGDNAGGLYAEIIQGISPGVGFDLGVPAYLQKSMMSPFDTIAGVESNTAAWGQDTMPCGVDTKGVTTFSDIYSCGCMLTSWAMLLDYYGRSFGVHTDPRVLNDYLLSHSGYAGGIVQPLSVLAYWQSISGGHPDAPTLQYGAADSHSTFDPSILNSLLEQDRPVILKVSDSHTTEHHVVVNGETTAPSGQPTWYINDPGFPYTTAGLYSPNHTLVDWRNTGSLMQWLEGRAPGRFSGFETTIASPAELLVTDAQGRRTGVDPTTGQSYNEIPGALYVADSVTDNLTGASHDYKTFVAQDAPDQSYTIQVLGTGTGTYTLYTYSSDTSGGSNQIVETGQASPGSQDVYTASYSSTSANSLTIVQGGTPPSGGTATPELGSGELLTTTLLPIGAALLYRRRSRRRIQHKPDDPIA